MLARLSVCAIALAGCRDVTNVTPPDGGPKDASLDGSSIDKSAGCVGSFGHDLADGFGRLDGTLVAVVPVTPTGCPRPNSTHLILEIRQGGDVYRMVTAIMSQVGNPDMAIAERDAPLAGPPWSEGWHLGIAFDYVNTLGLHRLDFAPKSKLAMAAAVTAPLQPGARISVFGTVEGQPDSGHLIHRNAQDADGAIVVNPDTTPHYILLRFDNQLF